MCLQATAVVVRKPDNNSDSACVTPKLFSSLAVRRMEQTSTGTETSIASRHRSGDFKFARGTLLMPNDYIIVSRISRCLVRPADESESVSSARRTLRTKGKNQVLW